MLALAGCSSDRRTEASTSNETNNPSRNTQSETGYFIPDYDTTNNLHCDEFLKILKSDGYIRGGEKDYNYNTDNITRIVNITPKSISDETSDIEVFFVSNIHCFLVVNHTIYRYDTFGGYHHQLCLWDYDNNGTKDLVSYNTSGSGLSYMSVDIFDLTSFEQIKVISYYLHNQFIPPFVSTFFTLNICLFSYCVQFVVQGRIEPYFISSWQCALYYIFLHNIIEPYFAPHSSYTNNINDYSFLSHTVLMLCTYAR
jgi:hypothetical protein